MHPARTKSRPRLGRNGLTRFLENKTFRHRNSRMHRLNLTQAHGRMYALPTSHAILIGISEASK